jgi:hypothetical protein
MHIADYIAVLKRIKFLEWTTATAVSLATLIVVTVILWWVKLALPGAISHPVFSYLVPTALLAMFYGIIEGALFAVRNRHADRLRRDSNEVRCTRDAPYRRLRSEIDGIAGTQIHEEIYCAEGHFLTHSKRTFNDAFATSEKCRYSQALARITGRTLSAH